MKKIFILSLLMLIFTSPSLAITDSGILEPADYNNKCGTYHVLTAVFEQGFTCGAGKYLPQGGTSAADCASCPAGNYCSGTVNTSDGLLYSDTADSGPVGITGVCNSGTYSTGGASAATCTMCPNNPIAWSTKSPNTGNPSDYDEQSDCTFTFVLNKNGGSGTITNDSGAGVFTDAGGTTPATITCRYGTNCVFGDPSSLSNSDGYTFDGWGTSTNCSTANPQTSFISSNLTQDTYYACRKGVMSGAITLNTDGAARNGNLNPIYVQYNTAFYDSAAGTSAITTVNRPGKPNKVFVGFFDEDGVKRIDETGKIMDDVKTLPRFKTAGETATWTAHYEDNYTITLDPGDGVSDAGTPALYAVSTTKGANAAGVYTDEWSLSDGVGKTIATKPEKTGYTFAGYWESPDANASFTYVDSDGKITNYLNERAKNADDGFTIYAHWTPNTIIISWYGVQDAGARSESVQYDGDIITPAKATEKPHYKFNGWYFSLTPDN